MTARCNAVAMAGAFALGGLLLVGCATTDPGASQPPAVVPVFEAPPPRVVFVNDPLQFVVVDFGAQPIPAVGSRLELYRGQQKTGSIVITEPIRGRFATADIVEGRIQRDDVVGASQPARESGGSATESE